VNLLDTDALSHLQKQDPVGTSIMAAMAASPDRDFRITTVNVYEMLDGAIRLLHDLKRKQKGLIPGYRLIQDLFDYLGYWQGHVLPYDDASERAYRGLTPRLRQELKDDARIAAIALRHGAAVWTCNVGDYTRAPGLTIYAAETGLRIP
jgi:predicted nucleic acid-binding protein